LLGGLLWTPPATTADEPPVLALDGHTERAPSSEERLVRSLLGVENGHLEEALRQATGLVEDQPDFKLGQMVYGDVLAALSGRLPRFAYAAPRGVAGGMRSEARARLQGYLQAPPAGAVPDELLQLPADVEQVILVDLEAFRLYVVAHEKGGLRIVGDYYASIGKGGIDKQREGDEKTPVGVYTVTGYLPDERLLDLYGIGAFPISYPNRWDIFRGRTGSGIWIHGTDHLQSATAVEPRLCHSEQRALRGPPAPGGGGQDAGHRCSRISVGSTPRGREPAPRPTRGRGAMAAGLGKPRHRSLSEPLCRGFPHRRHGARGVCRPQA
jgi:hypothetical protein